MAKDNFSKQSGLYAKFRPGYPKELFDFLTPLLPSKKTAWDVGTGNGQVAAILSAMIGEVYATDLSPAQIKNAVQKENIHYSTENAENSSFGAGLFDLITVGQAIHWFNFDGFYQEVRRTLKPSGILAVFGYDIFRVNPAIDAAIDAFYGNTLGSYWDRERIFIENHYRTIPFPFAEIEVPDFSVSYQWELENAVGYLRTWSAVQHYLKTNEHNPVDDFEKNLSLVWGNGQSHTVTFPVFIRAGRKSP